SILTCLSSSTLFPYTTLFRSGDDPDGRAAAVHRVPRPVRDHQPAPPGGDRGRGRARQAEALMLLGPALAVSATLFALGVLGVLRSEEHTSELQSQSNLVCRLL